MVNSTPNMCKKYFYLESHLHNYKKNGGCNFQVANLSMNDGPS